MPFDLSKIAARQRTVEIDGVGPVVFREPTLADYTRSQVDPYWWGSCISCPDGSPFVVSNADLGTVRADVAGRLLEEVNRPRPTEPAPAGSGESPVRSNA